VQNDISDDVEKLRAEICTELAENISDLPQNLIACWEYLGVATKG
jgi:hypothetical protein